MTRLALTLGIAALGMTACQMDNPAFDGQADAAEGSDGKSEVGDGDGDPTGGTSSSTGDGDGDPDPTTTGDGDGEPATTTGDGDGEPTTTGDGDGDPDPMTTGDGDGDGMVEVCVGFEPSDDCQQCAADHCCQPEIAACFEAETPCSCLVNCTKDQNKTLLQCVEDCQSDAATKELFQVFGPCMQLNCGNLCG